MSILIHDSIEFHNTASLEARLGMPGNAVVRIPQAVREKLNPRGRYQGLDSAGVELRLVTESARVHLALSSSATPVDLCVYRGDFAVKKVTIPAGATVVVELIEPELFGSVDPVLLKAGRFDSRVWRVQVSRGLLHYLGVDAFGYDLRPPLPEEKPSVRWLAYGSSITHSQAQGYPFLTARSLGVDVLNKGFGGSCHAEPELAAYFSREETWDFATLELGVNMRLGFSLEAFRERVHTFLETLRRHRPEAPLVLITQFPNRSYYPPEGADRAECERMHGFDEVLREWVSQGGANDYLIEGREMLRDLSGLSRDLLHPSDEGHREMADGLTSFLKKHLSAGGYKSR